MRLSNELLSFFPVMDWMRVTLLSLSQPCSFDSVSFGKFLFRMEEWVEVEQPT